MNANVNAQAANSGIRVSVSVIKYVSGFSRKFSNFQHASDGFCFLLTEKKHVINAANRTKVSFCQ